MEDTPLWIRLSLGLVSLLMALGILLSLFGVLPAAESFFILPDFLILLTGIAFLLFSLIFWLPANSLRGLRGWIGFLLFISVGTICNWAAFSPNAKYTTTGSLGFGPFAIDGSGGQLEARIVFSLVAIALDIIIVVGTVQWVRSWVARD